MRVEIRPPLVPLPRPTQAALQRLSWVAAVTLLTLLLYLAVWWPIWQPSTFEQWREVLAAPPGRLTLVGLFVAAAVQTWQCASRRIEREVPLAPMRAAALATVWLSLVTAAFGFGFGILVP